MALWAKVAHLRKKSLLANDDNIFWPLQIGEILKNKFDSAHEVHQKKKRGRRMLMPKFERFKPHTDTDLVYLKTSPDYCEFDVKKGSLGTHGRECDHVSVTSSCNAQNLLRKIFLICRNSENWFGKKIEEYVIDIVRTYYRRDHVVNFYHSLQ